MVLNMISPKKRLEWLMIAVSIAVVYCYLFIYQEYFDITINFIDLQTLFTIPAICLIIWPLIHLIVIKLDPLQKSPWSLKSVIFFQKEFPSDYLLKRCNMCIESEETCSSYIAKDSLLHAKYWFDDLFHGIIEEENSNVISETFKSGYNCKLIFYIKALSFFSLIVSIITIIISIVVFNYTFSISFLEIAFPIVALLFFIFTCLHKADLKQPSGCWQSWRRINRGHVQWLKDNEHTLINLICKPNISGKRFKKNNNSVLS